MMLERTLIRFIKIGRLTVVDSKGRRVCAGCLSEEVPQLDVVVRLATRLTALKIALRPNLYLGEAYMDGSLALERGSLWDLFDLCGRNLANRRSWHNFLVVRVAQAMRRLLWQYNSRPRSRRNVAHHYDLSETLFRSFLDKDMQYSCAYFSRPGCSLDEAQAAKKQHIMAKLLLEPEQRVLDIGCGWGGLAIAIAQTQPVQVTAVTLSREQAATTRTRARDADVDHRVLVELKDYREITGSFDRIVSVGMFEHVGSPNYRSFFGKLASLLTEDGVAIVHSIGRADGPGLTAAWTHKYIFPGGYIPALSEVLPAIERAGLWVTDIEILRLHYAETLRAWRERFLAHRAEIRDIYNERFCRMWEFYLTGSEMAFRYGGLIVFQLQLARRLSTVPLIRDYMVDWERASAARRSEALV
jgi:cyclopropane-fatty-acyl-phospholipid synthase